MKLKPLAPSLRERKRYLKYHVLSKNNTSITHKEIADAISTAYSNIYGTFNLGKAGIIYLSEYYDQETNTGVIRIHNNYIKQLQSVLCFVTSINHEEVIVQSIKTSGVLKRVRTNEVVKKCNK